MLTAFSEPKIMLRLLAVLLFFWVVLRCLSAALQMPDRSGSIVAVAVVFWIIAAIAYSRILEGGKTARALTTVYAAYSVIISFFIVGSGKSVAIVPLTAEAFICVAIIVIINTPTISTIRPSVQINGRPADENHEHNWQPHDLLNDWLRCTKCGVMQVEAGTIALINQKKS